MSDEIKSAMKVVGVMLGAFGVSMTQIEAVLKIAALVLSIAYTGWQFYRAKKKADKEDGR